MKSYPPAREGISTNTIPCKSESSIEGTSNAFPSIYFHVEVKKRSPAIGPPSGNKKVPVKRTARRVIYFGSANDQALLRHNVKWLRFNPLVPAEQKDSLVRILSKKRLLASTEGQDQKKIRRLYLRSPMNRTSNNIPSAKIQETEKQNALTNIFNVKNIPKRILRNLAKGFNTKTVGLMACEGKGFVHHSKSYSASFNHKKELSKDEVIKEQVLNGF